MANARPAMKVDGPTVGTATNLVAFNCPICGKKSYLVDGKRGCPAGCKPLKQAPKKAEKNPEE